MITKPKLFNRILAALVNYFLLIIVTFSFDALASSKVMRATTDYNTLSSEYIACSEEFAGLQDHYHIYIYNEEGRRIKNENVTQDDINAFNNDERVKELVIIGNRLNRTMATYSLTSLAISFGISILLVYYLPSLFFKKKHYNIGNKLFNLVMLKNHDFMPKYKYYLYETVYVIFHVILGTMSLFVLNLIDIIIASASNDRTTLLERLLRYDIAVDPDKIEANNITPERLYELNHSHEYSLENHDQQDDDGKLNLD